MRREKNAYGHEHELDNPLRISTNYTLWRLKFSVVNHEPILEKNISDDLESFWRKRIGLFLMLIKHPEEVVGALGAVRPCRPDQ